MNEICASVLPGVYMPNKRSTFVTSVLCYRKNGVRVIDANEMINMCKTVQIVKRCHNYIVSKIFKLNENNDACYVIF